MEPVRAASVSDAEALTVSTGRAAIAGVRLGFFLVQLGVAARAAYACIVHPSTPAEFYLDAVAVMPAFARAEAVLDSLLAQVAYVAHFTSHFISYTPLTPPPPPPPTIPTSRHADCATVFATVCVLCVPRSYVNVRALACGFGIVLCCVVLCCVVLCCVVLCCVVLCCVVLGLAQIGGPASHGHRDVFHPRHIRLRRGSPGRRDWRWGGCSAHGRCLLAIRHAASPRQHRRRCTSAHCHDGSGTSAPGGVICGTGNDCNRRAPVLPAQGAGGGIR